MLRAISNLPGLNLAKLGVLAWETQGVFFDESARLIDDPDHSGDEDRFVMLGFSFKPAA